MASPRIVPFVCALVSLAACEKGDIQVHRVPKTATSAEAAAVEQRLLGAIVPDGARTWFFKLMAETAAVGAQERTFSEFVHSLKIGTGDRPLSWTLPSGWTERPGSDMRYATLAIAPGIEVSVTQLDGPAGGVLANVNRWRNQLGLPPISEAELKVTCKEVDLNGRTAVLVDLSGRAKPGGSPPMSGGNAPHPPVASKSPESPESSGATGQPQMAPIDVPAPPAVITYSRPPEWKEKEAVPPRIANFTVGADAELVITAFPGDVGGELANVNRWRAQVGLDPTEQAGVDAARKTLLAGDLEARCYYLDGPERGMAAAIVKNADTSWFLKLSGPLATVQNERKNFDAFVASVRFTSGDQHDAGR